MTQRIQHPTTGKMVAVDSFPVAPREVLTLLKAYPGSTAKDIGLWLLGEARSAARMRQEMSGEGRYDNYALRSFENALDWSLGIAVLRILQAYRDKYRRLPKPFELLATRPGAILARFSTGQVVEVLGA